MRAFYPLGLAACLLLIPASVPPAPVAAGSAAAGGSAAGEGLPDDVGFLILRLYLSAEEVADLELPTLTLKPGPDAPLPPCGERTASGGIREDFLSSFEDLSTRLGEAAGDPAPFPYCAWWFQTGPPQQSGNLNIALPDSSAVYWTTPFRRSDDLEIVIQGSFPVARYMSLNVYDNTFGPFTYEGRSSALADYQIDPDPGTGNPYRHGDTEGAGTYTVTLEENPRPGERNVLPMHGDPAGGEAGSSRQGIFPAPCNPPAGPQRPDANPCPDQPYRFSRPNQEVTNSLFPNVDNAYLTAVITPQSGEVWALRGRAPTSPRDAADDVPQDTGKVPVAWPERRYQVRYWSMCNNVYLRPYPLVINDDGQQVGCQPDVEAALDDRHRYTFVVSSEEDRPSNVTSGQWIPFSADHPHARHVLMLRNMLPSEAFANAVQEVQTYDDWQAAQEVMGPYYPETARCATATYERGGADACFRELEDGRSRGGPAGCEDSANGCWYPTVTPFEHYDSGRSHRFPQATFPGAADGRNAVSTRAAPGSYLAPYNLVTGEANALFYYGGASCEDNAPGHYLTRLSADTLQQAWWTQLFDVQQDPEQWLYPGMAGVHANGYVYVIYGWELAKLDPESGEVVGHATLPTGLAQPQNTAYNGFDLLPDGKIVAKTVFRATGCTEQGFCAFLNCDTSTLPSVIVVVDPDTLEVLDQVQAGGPLGGRITVSQYRGRNYVYVTDDVNVYRYAVDPKGDMELDPEWGPVAYNRKGQTTASAVAVLGDLIVFTNNAQPTPVATDVIAISQADSSVLYRLAPFAGESHDNYTFSAVAVDPENGRVYMLDTGVGKIAALDLAETGPQAGLSLAWAEDQRTTGFLTLIGPPDARVLVGTDIPGRGGLSVVGLKNYPTEHAVWRDAATGGQLARSENLGTMPGLLVTPGFAGAMYFLDGTQGDLIEMTVQPAP